MNFTFFCLRLVNFNGLSPYFIDVLTQQSSFRQFYKIHARNFFQSFFFSSRLFHSISINDSHFFHFLSRPLTIASTNTYFDALFLTRFHSFEPQNISFFRCIFEHSHTIEEHGGIIWTISCNVIVSECTFVNNSAKFSGSVEFQDSPVISMNFTLISDSFAERFGAGHFDGHEPNNIAIITFSNFSNNRALKWIGGIRLQHNGGFITECKFEQNTAEIYGGLWDYGHKPSNRNIERSYFVNNSANEEGAGITAYHLLYRGMINNCLFWGNRN
jgi:hypothetical protein